MDADLDTLALALYVKIDELLVASPERVPWRPPVGIAPRISDAELVTLAVMQALLSFTSEARWLRHARSHLRHLFPYLPQQPGYNKRLRKLGGHRDLVDPPARGRHQHLVRRRLDRGFHPDRVRPLPRCGLQLGPGRLGRVDVGTGTAPATLATSGDCGCS
jgi:hypothetical protein